MVLDLNRDGKVELKNAAYFDLNANGFHEFTRWIDKTDAFLVLDKNFNGADGPNPNNTAAPILRELYADLVRDMEAGLLAQTHLKPFFERVEYKVTEPEKDAEGNVVKPGRLDILLDPALAWLGEAAKTDPRTALEQLWGLKKMMSDTETELNTKSRLKGKKGPPARGAAPKGLGGVEPEKQPLRFADANHLPFQGRQSILDANWYKQAAETSRKEAELRASYRGKLGLSVETPAQTDAEKAYAEFLGLRQKLGTELKGQGAELKDFLEGDITWQGSTLVLTREGTRYLYGDAGDDKLYGQDGDDVLVGGAGDDHLVGGYGSDTYVYNKGDGHDTIDTSTYYYDNGAKDRLKFGEGISAEDLEVIRRGNDVTFSLRDGSGSVRVQEHFRSEQYSLDEVEFADGTKWSAEDVASRAVTRGTDTNAAASSEPAGAPATPEAFSAVSPLSAMSGADARVLSESEIEESLAVLSTPSFMSGLEDEIPGGWSCSSSLAAVSSEPSAPVDLEVARLGMDVALAGLSFEKPNSGLVCDALLSGSSGVEAVKLSVSAETGLEKHFEKGAHQAELSRSAA